MSNLGRAIYMACFTLLFIFATSTSIYLYNTLSVYLKSTAGLAGVEKRTEASVADTSKKNRDVTRSEILITLCNMEQMHVKAVNLRLNGVEINVTAEDAYNVTEGVPNNYSNALNELNKSAYNFATFSYSYNSATSTITYSQN